MFVCLLCEKESCYVSRFCPKCRRVKHLLNLYEERVYDVLENVLVRAGDKQDNKIKVELKKEIESKEYNLRSKEKKEGLKLLIK